MDVVKPLNKWVMHIKDFAAKNGISYREAMRSEACKAAYKAPPEPAPPVEPVKMSKPVLVRSEPEAPSEPELIQPTVVKKERTKRVSKLVPTNPVH